MTSGLLLGELQFNNKIQPICVPRSCADDCTAGANAIISGWGTTAADGTKPSQALQKATVPIVTNTVCQRGFTANNITRRVTLRTVCVGYSDGSVDPCRGDDGGPLSCKTSSNSRYFLSGIKSFVDKCGIPGLYSPYTRYYQWKNIEKSVRPVILSLFQDLVKWSAGSTE